MARIDDEFGEEMNESAFESALLSPTTPEQKYLEAAIRDGDLDRARSFVENLNPEMKRKITKDSRSMLATLRKNDPEFIRFLVEECDTDLEKPMMNPFRYPCWNRNDENCVNSITPLHYAAMLKKTKAVDELLRLGANVNATSSSSRASALHAACENGALLIAKHLIQHGADLTIRDKNGKTALMCGIHHVNVCRELIRGGADVNATDNDGNTALHLATRRDIAVVKLLIKKHADLLRKNVDGEDALCIACVYRKHDALKCMTDQLPNDDVGHQALIRSHQLLGSCYVDYYCYGFLNDVDKALDEWKTAVTLREERQPDITGQDDVVSTPNSAYDNAVEVDSMVKFDEMRQDVNKICMQGLLLKEKILGPTHHETIESVMLLAEYYLDSEDYGRGLRLLRHYIKLSRDRRVDFTMKSFDLGLDEQNLDSVYGIIHCASCNKQAVLNTLDFKDIHEFLEDVIHEARRQRQPTTEDNCFVKSYIECAENESVMQITLFLVKLFFLLEANEVNTAQFRRLMHDFVRLNLRSREGRTVLMEAICPDNPYDYGVFSIEAESMKLLLECGADTWETDNEGNSVLHLLAKSEQWMLDATEDIPSKETNRKVAEVLLAFGAHFDARNNEGFSAVDYLSSLGLELSTHMTLQCLAARAIRRHKIPYAGILPKSLVDFVQMH